MRVLCLYVGLTALGAAVGDSVLQNPLALSLIVGQNGTIGCNFTTSSVSPDLFWYRQLQNHSPHKLVHLTSFRTSDEAAEGRFSAVLDWKLRLVTLTVSLPDPEDNGAVYYCALTDTGSRKLLFGAGTKLSVKPNIPDSSPSVYHLKPAAGHTTEVGPACLITDFSPANSITIFLNETTIGKRPASLVRSGLQWSYAVVEWSNTPNDEQFKCMAHYNGRPYTTQDVTDDVMHTSCTAASVTESFKTDEKLNTLSLAVLALKIIFLKSIAFNLLITVRLWIY